VGTMIVEKDHLSKEGELETEIEARIVEIADAVIEKHHILIMKNLYYDCTRMLKDVDRFAIFHAIDRLIKRRILFPRATLTRAHVLANHTRDSIYSAIKENPGIHVSKIKRLLDLGSNVVVTHLIILEKFGYIRSKTIGLSTVYFDKALGEMHDRFYYYLHKDDTLDILKALLQHPGTSFVNLFNLLQISRSTLSRKIDILASEGFLIITREANTIKEILLKGDYREIVGPLIEMMHE
jgi:predicted transcriptional regulator